MDSKSKRYEITLSNKTHTSDTPWKADWLWVARMKAFLRSLLTLGEHDAQIRDTRTGRFVVE